MKARKKRKKQKDEKNRVAGPPSRAGRSAERSRRSEQETIGNHGILRKIESGELEVSDPNDRYEREANRVVSDLVHDRTTQAHIETAKAWSSRVVQSPSAAIGPDEEARERMDLSSSHEKQQKLENEELDAKSELEPIRPTRLGHSIYGATKRKLERRMGVDLSDVRIHDGPDARSLAAALNAKAFTHGSDIWLGPGASDTDVSLMAHEATHVIQQQRAHRQLNLDLDRRSARYEEQAERVSSQVAEEKTSNITSPNQLSIVPEMEEIDTQFHSTLTSRRRNGDVEGLSVTHNYVDLSEENDVASVAGHGADTLYSLTGGCPGMTVQLQDASTATTSSPSTLTGKTDKEVIQEYRELMSWARTAGYDQAAENLEYFLSAQGGLKKIPVSWVRSFQSTQDAEDENILRFKNDTLYPKVSSLKSGQTDKVEDHWDNSITAYDYNDLYYASGTSTLRSRGKFTLTHTGSDVKIDGVIQHDWYDYYDWHFGLAAWIPFWGTVPDTYGKQLVKNNKAAAYDMRAAWHHTVEGTFDEDAGWFWFDEYTLDPANVRHGPASITFSTPRGTFRN